jgi:AhpD family alkylhydroperoxidase
MTFSSLLRHPLRTAIAALTLAALAVPATAQDAYQAALDDIASIFGTVPSFMAQFPRAALPGAWAEMKGLLLNPDTALDPKTKALVAVGVSAAIGCQSCLWMDSNEALRSGATEEQLHEAIGIAALETHWSTMIDGLQIDLATIKGELGGGAE